MSSLTAAQPSTYQTIPVDQIRPSPHQARKDFDEEGIRSLAESIQREGLLEPIIVRPVQSPMSNVQSPGNDLGPRTLDIGQAFELIAGERRLRAVKLNGSKTIEARILETKDEADAAAKGLLENLQRQDLNPIEEAEAFQTLNQLDPKAWTQEKISEVAGKDRTYVTRSLSLLRLAPEIQDNVRRRTLSRDHGLELARLPNQKLQLKAARQIPGKLTREETRALVNQMIGKPQGKGGNGDKAPTAAQFLANEGFQFTAAGSVVNIRAGWDRTTDLEDFLARLRAALALWCSQNSNETPANTLPGIQESVTSVPTIPGIPGNPGYPGYPGIPGIPGSKDAPRAETPRAPLPTRVVIDGALRIPANPQEVAELEALAHNGPGPVFAWICGPDSPEARQSATQTWQELGHADALTGCRKTVEMMKIIAKANGSTAG